MDELLEQQRYEKWREVLNYYLALQYSVDDAEHMANLATNGKPTIIWRT